MAVGSVSGDNSSNQVQASENTKVARTKEVEKQRDNDSDDKAVKQAQDDNKGKRVDTEA